MPGNRNRLTKRTTRTAQSSLARRAWLAGAATLLAGSATSVSGSAGQERVCFLLHVKKGRLAEYKERHKKVWPEMLQALRETGWHNYSLFLRDDGLLIGYLETPDFEKARAGMVRKEVNTRWQNQMADFLRFPREPMPTKRCGPFPKCSISISQTRGRLGGLSKHWEVPPQIPM